MSLQAALLKAVRLGGKLATEAEYQRRKAICDECPHKGRVNVGFQYEGCTVCGCPFETKLRLDWHVLNGLEKNACPKNKW